MKLMYVFDPRESSGYVMRVPEIVAKFVCRFVARRLDYAPTEKGF